ncbi:unnamed protein product [Jaminaea pallidilutea]
MEDCTLVHALDPPSQRETAELDRKASKSPVTAVKKRKRKRPDRPTNRDALHPELPTQATSRRMRLPLSMTTTKLLLRAARSSLD